MNGVKTIAEIKVTVRPKLTFLSLLANPQVPSDLQYDFSPVTSHMKTRTQNIMNACFMLVIKVETGTVTILHLSYTIISISF